VGDASQGQGDGAVALFENRCFSSLNLMTFLLYGAFGGAMLLSPMF
jgi:hypothetical protein